MDLYLPALVAAFLITVVEMTEVVALVFALSADHGSVRTGAMGATSGTVVVALVAAAFGTLLIAFPRWLLLWASALLLLAFGVFLFRSTLRSYRRTHGADVVAPSPPSGGSTHALQFAGGFSIGAVEAIETVIVLLALAAAGYGVSALVGALAGGGVLVAAAAVVHERIRRIKVPLLKLGATSLLFSFALFWGGEAAGVPWPYGDLVLLPFFAVAVVLVRGAVGWRLRSAVPVQTKG